MRYLKRRNPPRPSYDAAEILKLCKLTSLSYPEIAVFLGIPTRVVLRICSKKTKRTGGRPPRLDQLSIDNKIKQIKEYYKKNGRRVDQQRLEQLRSYLLEKLIKESGPKRPIKEIKPERKLLREAERKKKKNSPKRTLKRKPSIEAKESRIGPVVTEPPARAFRLSQEQALVIDFLVEREKKKQQNIPFSMKKFAAHKGVNYDNFTRLVKRQLQNVLPIANEMLLRAERTQLEEKYRAHVIDFLARQELLSENDEVLTKLDYVEQNQLDRSIFMRYFQEFKHQVKDEVVQRYRELEEERLQRLRSTTLEEELERARELPSPEDEPSEKRSILTVLEKAAKKRLPVRKGRIIFSSKHEENARLEDVWTQIAEDVSQIGLRDAVAEKWASEMGLPPTLPKDDRITLILLRIETVLRQLDMFQPPKSLSFEVYRRWVEAGQKPKIAPPEVRESLIEAPIPILPVPSEKAKEELFAVSATGPLEDETWLAAEIAREEAEARRYIDSPEERHKRRREGNIISSDQAELLSRPQLEELRQLGAIYENGDWLVACSDDLNRFITAPQESPARNKLLGWDLPRKPRILVGIGTTDYTKEWMDKAFDMERVIDAATFENRYYIFQPDVILVYKSSIGKQLYNEAIRIGKETDTPVLIFDKGFADVLQWAQKQGLRWFIDAHTRRHVWQRRLNPFNWLKTY